MGNERVTVANTSMLIYFANHLRPLVLVASTGVVQTMK